MKTLFIFILILSYNAGIIYSQTDRCSTQTTETVKTDPNDAINERYPSKTNTNGRVLNWMESQFNVNTQYLSPNIQSIYSPFYQSDNSIINHFLNNKDFKPEDGWELIRRGFGYNDDGSIYSDENNPYFILYNKFLGILRVFSLVGNNKVDYHYANVILKFKDIDTEHVSSLLDLTFSDSTKPLQSLSEFPTSGVNYNNLILSNISKFENNEKKWFYADFAITYDPCTCLYKSKLWIEVRLINEANINIVGILEGVLANIEGKVSSDSESKVDKAEASITIAEIGKNIVETHKSVQKFNTDVSNHIDEFYKNDSDKKDSTKAKLNILSAILGDGIISKAFKMIPILGDVLTFIDFFVGGGKSSSPQSVKLMPTSIKAKLALTGTLTSTPTFQSIIFWNPGSNFTSSPFEDIEYPIYDQVLGTFNLLKAPKVSVNKSSYSTCYDCIRYDGAIESWSKCNYMKIDTLSIKLSEHLKYVLNPVAFSTSPDDVEILAAIEFDIKYDLIYAFDWNLISQEIPLTGIVHVRDNTFRTQYYPIQCLTDEFFKFYIKTEFQNLQLPTHCAYLPSYNLTINNMKIQLLNLYKRNDLNEYPEADDIFELRTYGVSDITETNDINDNDDYSLSGFLNTLVLQDTTIASDITVWGDIEIGENVTLVGSTTYEITSIHGSITVKAGAVLSPNLILKVGYQSSCYTPMYAPVSQNDILTFCQSNQPGGYRPAERDFKIRVDTEELQSSDRMYNIYFGLDIFPNPSTTEINLKFSVPQSGSLKLVIHNMLGETVQVPINNENHSAGGFSIPVDVSSLIPGVYYCTMYSPHGIVTKSFMVMR